MSRLLEEYNNQIKEKFYQFSDQIEFFTPPICFGKTNEITITNVKWVSDDEYDSDSDSDSESNSDIDPDYDSD